MVPRLDRPVQLRFEYTVKIQRIQKNISSVQGKILVLHLAFDALYLTAGGDDTTNADFYPQIELPSSHLDQETKVNILTLWLLTTNLPVLVVANVDSLAKKKHSV